MQAFKMKFKNWIFSQIYQYLCNFLNNPKDNLCLKNKTKIIHIEAKKANSHNSRIKIGSIVQMDMVISSKEMQLYINRDT